MIDTRQYPSQAGITPEYAAVRRFLIRLGYSEYIYARWDWMITHSYLEHEGLSKIRLWEEEGEVIAVATFDTRLGIAYCLYLPTHEALKAEMLSYAEKNLNSGDQFCVVIRDDDVAFQTIAKELGFEPTEGKEHDAIIQLDEADLSIELPEGFSITSMAERYDPLEYKRVLWRGFDHELNGEGPYIFTDAERADADFEMIRDNVDLSLKLAAVNPEGHFVAYCGMWYDQETNTALIEPLATDPDFRRLGLARAIVREGFRRVKNLGATQVLVGSSQAFYYSIGMSPYRSATLWKRSVR